MITGTLVFLALATFWAAALDCSDTRGFLKNWTLCVAAIMGLALLGTFFGLVTRSALCGTVWYAECV